MSKGTVQFVGAGPGDPRLVTVRGAELLSRATHVFYDADVHPDLVARAPEGAERVAVARSRGGEHPERMAELALGGARVVRLFAGDPLLFRWGDEEVARVTARGVAIEIVAGVTSVTAASAYGGLALVRSNDASPSVAFAAVRDAAELHDWTKLSLATDTIALITDSALVDEITATLTYYGRSPTSPAALLRDVSLPTQKVVTGTLVEMRRRTAEMGKGEVMLLVGEPLAFRAAIRWFDTRPLFGKRVLSLRAREQADVASSLVRERGGEPVCVPAIEIHPPDDPAALRAAARGLDRWDWVVFTSANGVRAFWEALGEAGLDARALGGKGLGAIGPGTARAIAEHGVRADVVAKEFRGEGLAEELARAMKPGSRVLVPRATEAREALPEALRAAGHAVDVVFAYRTRAPEGAAREALRAAVSGADVVLLTSASTIKNLADAIGPDAAAVLAGRTVASIGPITTDAAKALGVRVDVTAATYTLEGLVEAIEAFFARVGPGPVS